MNCATGKDEVSPFLPMLPSLLSHLPLPPFTYNVPLFSKPSPSPMSFFASHFLLLYFLLLFPFLIIPPFISPHPTSPFFLSPLGDPLQFPGNSGGAGEADVQRSGRRHGGLVWFPSGLPLLPHPLRRDSIACVDGYLHWCSQGTPAQRTAQVRSG